MTKKQHVLVVDDDPIALAVARERLEALGFAVSTRDQSLGTSGWILENQPAFVLLDVMMPALTGGELANLLKRRLLQTGIILYSSKPQRELDFLARQIGVLGAISKRLNGEDFSREVERLTAETRVAKTARGGS